MADFDVYATYSYPVIEDIKFDVLINKIDLGDGQMIKLKNTNSVNLISENFVFKVHDPIVVNDEAVVDEDNQLSFNILSNDSDIEGNAIINISSAENGIVNYDNNGNVIYIPNENFKGIEYLTYEVDNGQGKKNTGEIKITVNSENDFPVINLIQTSYQLNEDGFIEIDILSNASDREDGKPKIIDITGASNGNAEVVDGHIVYIPNKNFNGEEVINFKLVDNDGAEINQTITLTVDSVNDMPIATIINSSTVEDNIIMAVK